ncbi:MAG: hypothetical protein KAH32_02895, partial [Chlamydiia bacterium]|nr:hypothetical protein [Chlamydiia bacterium]
TIYSKYNKMYENLANSVTSRRVGFFVCCNLANLSNMISARVYLAFCPKHLSDFVLLKSYRIANPVFKVLSTGSKPGGQIPKSGIQGIRYVDGDFGWKYDISSIIFMFDLRIVDASYLSVGLQAKIEYIYLSELREISNDLDINVNLLEIIKAQSFLRTGDSTSSTSLKDIEANNWSVEKLKNQGPGFFKNSRVDIASIKLVIGYTCF